jgi:ABC-type dipeptide/oligopeptide/nickel transport system permease subunit
MSAVPGPSHAGRLIGAIRRPFRAYRARSAHAPRSRRIVTAIAWAALVFFLLLAFVGPLVATKDPNAQAYEPLLPPFSPDNLLGTDELGRDQLTRLVYGARPLILVSIGSVAVAVLIGSLIGFLAGLRHGWVETSLMRAMDAVLAFPVILLALLIIAVIGTGVPNLIIAIAISQIPVFARLVRALTAREMAREYVLAARAAGFSSWRIVRSEILPNVAGPTIVQAMSTLAVAAGFASAFSYLGVGIQPPTADWGYMVKSGQQYVFDTWELAVFPAVMITLFVVAANFAGDALRDMFETEDRR